MPFKYFEHTADVLFEASGKSLEEMFNAAGQALGNTMIELKQVEAREEKEIKAEGNTEDKLLHEFLEKVLLLIQMDLFIAKEFQIKIKEKEKKFFLEGKALGEKIDKSKHEIMTDIKAVTWENFKVWQEKGQWKASVMLDV